MDDPLDRLRRLLGEQWSFQWSTIEAIASACDEIERLRAQRPEGGSTMPVAWGLVNKEGKLHSLTLFQEVAEHNAKVLSQTVVPLYLTPPQSLPSSEDK